jgi:hypothetical protein
MLGAGPLAPHRNEGRVRVLQKGAEMTDLAGFRRLVRGVAYVAVLLPIAGCRFYPQPVLEEKPPDPPVSIGLLEQVATHDVTDFRVIFVHGMGLHDEKYAERWIVDYLAPTLGLVADPAGNASVPIVLRNVAVQPQPAP